MTSGKNTQESCKHCIPDTTYQRHPAVSIQAASEHDVGIFALQRAAQFRKEPGIARSIRIEKAQDICVAVAPAMLDCGAVSTVPFEYEQLDLWFILTCQLRSPVRRAIAHDRDLNVRYR